MPLNSMTIYSMMMRDGTAACVCRVVRMRDEEKYMCSRVSSAGIVVDEHHGLVDCGPRRLDPEAEWFRQVQRPASPLYPTIESETLQSDAREVPASSELTTLPEHN